MEKRMSQERKIWVVWGLAIWNFLFSPEAALAEMGKRRQAQAVAALTFLLFIGNTAGIFGTAAALGTLNSDVILLIVISAVAGFCYFLARTRYYRIGLTILLAGIIAATFTGPIFSPDDVYTFVETFLPFIFLLPLGIYTAREMLGLTGVTLIITLCMRLYIPSITSNDYWTLVGQVFSVGILAIAVAGVREVVERVRLEESRRSTEELQKLSASLEDRVAERTRAIALAAEIGRQVSQVRDLERLLPQAVEMIREQFNLYYVQMYLTDPQNRSLQLRAGSGDVGAALLRAGHRLPVDLTSLNGTAALERRPIVVENTITTPSFRPHRLLPYTRAEIAVPLLSGDRVLGVLDLQAREIGSLNEENLPVFETLAGLLASALANIELIAQVQSTLEEEQQRVRVNVRDSWNSYLDAIHTRERIAYSYDGASVSSMETPIAAKNDPSVLTVPVAVSGEPIGAFQLEADQAWSPEDAELVRSIAEQVAQQLESLRLLGQSENYRQQAEEAVRRLTGQEWQEYLKESDKSGLAFVYAGGQVQSLEEGNNGHEPTAHVDIVVNEQPVGQIGIAGIENLPQQDTELVETIAQQLSAHLENMRLYTSAQRELEERRRTESQLEYQRRNLQAVLDNMAAGVFMVEVPSGRAILSNRRAEHFLGRGISPDAREDDLNQIYQAFRYGTDDLYPAQDMPVVAGMRGISAHIDDMEVRRPDGSRVLLDVTGSPVYDSEGSLVASVVVFQDITLRRQAEELIAKRAAQLATVSEVATVISTISNPDEMLQTVVDMTKASFALYHAHIYLMNEAGDTLVLTKGAGDVGRQMVSEGRLIRLDSEKSLVARAARTREGVIVNNVHLDREFLPHPLLPNTQAEMAVPLMVGDRLLGVLDVQSDRVGNFSEDDILIKTTLASQVAVALQNARQYVETRASEELVRTVIDSTPDWIYIKDNTHRYRLVNHGYASALHLEPEDFIGKDDLELGYSEDQVKGNPEKGIRGFWADERLVLETNQPQHYPEDVTTVDGRVRIFDTFKTPLRDVYGTPWGVLSFARDVTDLQNLLQQNRVLYEGSRQLSRCATFDDVVRVLAENTLLGQFSGATLNMFDRPWNETAPNSVRVAAVWKKEAVDWAFTTGQVLPLQALPGIELQAKSPTIVSGDAQKVTDLDPEISAFLTNKDIHAIVAFKVMVSGEYIGVINAVSPQIMDFSENEVRTFLSLAEQAVTMIQNLRLFEQVQRALEETAGLYAANRRLIEAQDLNEMLHAVVEALNVPSLSRAALYLFEYNEVGEIAALLVRENWNLPGEMPSFPAGTRFVGEEAGRILYRMKTNVPVFVEEETDEGARRAQISSAVILPLWIANRQLGSIAMTSPEPTRFHDDEKRISASLAQQASIAVQNRLLLESAQERAKREQSLREITARVRSSMDPETILRTAVRELGAATGRKIFIRMGNAEQLAQKPDGGSNGNGAGHAALTGEGDN